MYNSTVYTYTIQQTAQIDHICAHQILNDKTTEKYFINCSQSITTFKSKYFGR